MRIGGLQKFSLIDYPGRISAILFTSGCNFKCPYCHNPGLVNSTKENLSLKEVYSFLKDRNDRIDAVVITGGEPTLHDGLFDLIKTIKEMGYLVKLDTNGTNSKLLSKLIKNNFLDYIAMDIKSNLENYAKIAKVKVNLDEIKNSIKLILSSNISYEFRTTVVSEIISKEDILSIGELLKGASKYVLQKFISSETLDNNFINSSSFTDEEFAILKNKLEKYISEVAIR